MQIWPAIDLRGGRCVRLLQGDYDRETVYGDDPLEMAGRWVDQGATHLHVVDLDGARDGLASSEPSPNQSAISQIAREFSLVMQVGGGIRDRQTIERLVDAGVDRLVIGTRALNDPEWAFEMIESFPQRLVIGIDARDGMVATDGWVHTSEIEASELARRFEGHPVAGIVYTDISRDGMLGGPNFLALEQMAQSTELDVIASGGVTTLEDIHRLAQMRLAGAILGRALYEQRVELVRAIETAAAAGSSNANNSETVT